MDSNKQSRSYFDVRGRVSDGSPLYAACHAGQDRGIFKTVRLLAEQAVQVSAQFKRAEEDNHPLVRSLQGLTDSAKLAFLLGATRNEGHLNRYEKPIESSKKTSDKDAGFIVKYQVALQTIPKKMPWANSGCPTFRVTKLL